MPTLSDRVLYIVLKLPEMLVSDSSAGKTWCIYRAGQSNWSLRSLNKFKMTQNEKYIQTSIKRSPFGNGLMTA